MLLQIVVRMSVCTMRARGRAFDIIRFLEEHIVGMSLARKQLCLRTWRRVTREKQSAMSRCIRLGRRQRHSWVWIPL